MNNGDYQLGDLTVPPVEVSNPPSSRRHPETNTAFQGADKTQERFANRLALGDRRLTPTAFSNSSQT
jgi:hypothetical protein